MTSIDALMGRGGGGGEVHIKNATRSFFFISNFHLKKIKSLYKSLYYLKPLVTMF